MVRVNGVCEWCMSDDEASPLARARKEAEEEKENGPPPLWTKGGLSPPLSPP